MKISWISLNGISFFDRSNTKSIIVSKNESLLLNSKSIRVIPNQKYELKATITCRSGISNAAYLCAIMLDEDKKEINRKIRWIDDFSGKPFEYTLFFESTDKAAFAELGFRINIENQPHASIPTIRGDFDIDLPNMKLLRLEISNSDLEDEFNFLIASPFNPLKEEEEDILERKLVWIFGSPRTGSSWLAGGLLDHEQNILWDEPLVGAHFINFDYLENERTDYFYSRAHRHSWQPWLRKMILSRAYSQCRTLTKNLIIKEPNATGGIAYLVETFPNSKLLFLLRDGRDVIDSLIDAHKINSWNRDLSSKPLTTTDQRLKTIEEYSTTWTSLTNLTLATFNKHPSNMRLLVRYEELRRDTVIQLQKIYDFLGISISKETLEKIVEKNRFENINPKLRGIGKAQRFATPGKWRENFTSQEINVMETIMGDTLRKLNYD